MKLLQLAFILLFSSITGGDISEANRHKELASEAYQDGNFELAIQHYHYLIDSLHLNDPALALNLGHAYYQHLQSLGPNEQLQPENGEDDSRSSSGMKMIEYYTRAASSAHDKEIKANAYHQMGVGLMQLAQLNQGNEKEGLSVEESYTASLESFKNALKNNPYNEETRYNYELVKKLFEEFKKQQEEEKKKKKDNNEEEKEDEKEDKNEEDKDNKKDENEQKKQKGEKEKKEEDKSKEGEEGDKGEDKEKAKNKQEGDPNKNGEGKDKEKEGGNKEGGADSKSEATEEQKEALKKMMNSKRLKEINMTKEKAKMILEAMKAQEMQYYQNMKKGVRKKKKSSKPDW